MKHKSGAKANLWWAKIWVNFPHYCYLTPMMILILVLEILMSLIWELLLPRWRGRTNDGRTEEMGEDQIWRHFGWGDTVDGDDGDHIGGFHGDGDGDVELLIKRRIKLDSRTKWSKILHGILEVFCENKQKDWVSFTEKLFGFVKRANHLGQRL